MFFFFFLRCLLKSCLLVRVLWLFDSQFEPLIVLILNVSVIRPNYLSYYIFCKNDLGKVKNIHIFWLIKSPSLLFRDSWDYWNNITQAHNSLAFQTWYHQLQIKFLSLPSVTADFHGPAGGKVSSSVGITFTQSACRFRWRSLGSSLVACYYSCLFFSMFWERKELYFQPW